MADNTAMEFNGAFESLFKNHSLAILSDDQVDPPRAIIAAPAIKATPELVNELLFLTGGLLFVAVSSNRASAFMLSRMTRPPSGAIAVAGWEPLNFCVSVEAREGVTTGISAHDRSLTVSILGEEFPNPRKLVQPGHIFPVTVKDGGVLVTNSLAEGALDLVKSGGFSDAALFADLLTPDGTFPDLKKQKEIAGARGIPFVTLTDLTRHRLETEKLVYRVAEARLPTRHGGEVRSIIYKSTIHDGEHLALVKGEIDPEKPTLTRIQPEFTFSDVFGGATPPTRHQLHQSLKAIENEGAGVLIYLRRPVGGQLKEQITSWDEKFREHPAALMREYGVGAQILRDLGIRKIASLTHSKKNLVGLKTFGLEIVSQLPIPERVD